jgi:hypothetical protein
LVLVIQIAFALHVPIAMAECGGGKWIFVREDASQGRWGVRGKILSRFHSYEGSCVGAVYTTIHHSDCAYVTCWTHVEIGIHETQQTRTVFTEKQVAGDTKFFEEWALPPVNAYVLFRIRGESKSDGTVDYHMEYNMLDGLGW